MKISKTISIDADLFNEITKRNLNLNDLMNHLLAEHIAILEIKENKSNGAKVV
jgi:hypothetical protein